MEEKNEQKTNNKKKKIIIGIVTAIAICIISYVGYFSISFFYRLCIGIDEIKDKISEYNENNQEREDKYDSIIDEMIQKNLIPSNLKYVSNAYGWSMEWVDRTNKYYFYIDSNNYDKYKSYWLEGIDKSQYRDRYNTNLARYGDYVFKAININDLTRQSDGEYCNIYLTANKTYYLVTMYDEAIYYRYISASDVKGETEYYEYSAFNCKEESMSNEYIFHEENNQWVIEKLIR